MKTGNMISILKPLRIACQKGAFNMFILHLTNIFSYVKKIFDQSG